MKGLKPYIPLILTLTALYAMVTTLAVVAVTVVGSCVAVSYTVLAVGVAVYVWAMAKEEKWQ